MPVSSLKFEAMSSTLASFTTTVLSMPVSRLITTFSSVTSAFVVDSVLVSLFFFASSTLTSVLIFADDEESVAVVFPHPAKVLIAIAMTPKVVSIKNLLFIKVSPFVIFLRNIF